MLQEQGPPADIALLIDIFCVTANISEKDDNFLSVLFPQDLFKAIAFLEDFFDIARPWGITIGFILSHDESP